MLAYPIRLALFGVLTGGIYAVLHNTHQSGAASLGRENGPIETAQVGLAIFATVAFAIAAFRTRIGTVGLTVCGVMLAYAAARESDLWFERVFFDDAYKFLVGVPALVLLAAVAYRYRGSIIGDTLHLLNQPAATIFILAGIFLAFVCQTLDRPGMWAASDLATKTLIEETVELFAYLMFALSATESIWFARSTRCPQPAVQPTAIELKVAA